jgi:hypothetical protein
MSSYIPIASQTLGSSAASVTFSSIPTTLNGKTLRDLVLVFRGGWSGGGTIVQCRFNGDATSTNYFWVEMEGSPPQSPSSQASQSNLRAASFSDTTSSMVTVQIMDFAQTNKHKSALHRHDDATQNTISSAWRYASTSAITSITFIAGTGTLNTGSTFNLFGIEG